MDQTSLFLSLANLPSGQPLKTLPAFHLEASSIYSQIASFARFLAASKQVGQQPC